MKIEFTMSSLVILDTIASGVDTGIRYWAKVVTFWIPGRVGRLELVDQVPDDLQLVCEIIELETDQRISLQGKWGSALRLMAERCPRHFANMLTGNGDATTGNVLIQLAAFGQLRYD